MRITRQELVEMGACSEGLIRYTVQTDGTEEPVDVASLVGGENTIYDFAWLINVWSKIEAEDVIRFACDCALLSVEKIKPFTDKYELIYNYLIDPTPEIKGEVYKAALCAAEEVPKGSDKAILNAICAVSQAAYFDAGAASFAYSIPENKERVLELLRKLFDTAE